MLKTTLIIWSFNACEDQKKTTEFQCDAKFMNPYFIENMYGNLVIDSKDSV